MRRKRLKPAVLLYDRTMRKKVMPWATTRAGKITRIAFLGIFALGGIYALLTVRAASAVVSLEPEKGVITAPAAAMADTAASGGSAVQFKTASATSTQRFPGDPNPLVTHKAYFGSSYAGNGDVRARYETTAGKSLSIHRTFWAWDQHDTPSSDGLYNMVKADHAANRLPYVSTKTPPWAEVAAGKHDARIDQLLRTLDSYGKPVWLTFHHEPEGGGSNGNTPDDPGGPTAWRGMQSRVRARMNALGTKHIAFMPTLMAYTWSPYSGRNPEEWWVPGIWDAYMVDHYQYDVAGDMFTPLGWKNFAAWADAKKIPYGTGEWGNRGTDAVAASEMVAFWEWGFRNNKDVIAHDYFDSDLNSPQGGWTLAGSQYTKFIEILRDDTKVMRINDLR
jgi:hypothetical protein